MGDNTTPLGGSAQMMPLPAPPTHPLTPHPLPPTPTLPHPAVRKAIKESYDARDHAQEDMASLLKQFENDKMERNKEWQLYTSAIEEADKEGLASNMPLGIQGMTKEEEAEIKKKIRHGQMTMAKEKNMLLLAKAKITAYNEALAYIRQQTGYEDLQDVVDLFNKYEEEKYEKLGAISRLVSGVERSRVEWWGVDLDLGGCP